MPGCKSCGGAKGGAVAYEVKFNNGQGRQTYPTLAEAQQALRDAGKPAGSSITPVAK